MGLSGISDVSVEFANGQIPPAPATTDSVFLCTGASSRGQINTVYGIVDPSTIPTMLGYGPLAELVAQAFVGGATIVYACPANPTAGTVGTVQQSRLAAPTLVITSIMGEPGTPMDASTANTGAGIVTYDESSTPVISSTASNVTVTITTGGVPGGTLVATITVGASTTTNVPITSTPVTDPNGSGLVFDFSVPLGNDFAVGDVFTSISTPNDDYNVVVNVVQAAANGVSLWQYSLDGGNTYSSQIAAQLGGTITVTGNTQPVLTLGGTAPTARHSVLITCTQQGTARGHGAQVGTYAGYLYNITSPTSANGAISITTPPSGVAPLVTASITGTGTAAGSANSGNIGTVGHGSGTAAGSVTIGANTYTFGANTFPATFTDLVTGIVLSFNSANNLTSGDSYTNSGLLQNNNASTDNSKASVIVTTAMTNSAGIPFGNSANSYLFNGVSPSAAHGVAHISTPPTSGAAVPVAFLCTGTGTAVGSANTASPATGTGTAAGTLIIGSSVYTFAANAMPATFTDSVTGTVVKFTTSAHNLTSGDAYTNAGTLANNNGSSAGTAAVVAVVTGTNGLVAVPILFTVTGSGTAVGSDHSTAANTTAGTGTGTANGTLVIGANTYTFTGTLPATFTDSFATGIVLNFSNTAGTSSTEFESGDAYSGTVAALAAVPVSLVVTGSGTAATATATSLAPNTGTGTAGAILTIGPSQYVFPAGTVPATFTDEVTAIVVKIGTGVDGTGIEAGDTYAGTCQTAAQFSIAVDGSSPTTGVTVNSSGVPSTSPNIPGVAGPTLTFAHSGTDIYSYSPTSGSATTSYAFNLFPAYSYQPAESTGQLIGLNFAFGFGTYLNNDSYVCVCTSPSVVSGDVETAVTDSFASLKQSQISVSMLFVAAEAAIFAAAGPIASAVNAILLEQAQSPTWNFVAGVVFGPTEPSSASGCTPTDFQTATASFNLEWTGMTCRADYLTSTITGRTNLRNCGYGDIALFASSPVQVQIFAPGQAGAIPNVTQTTTTLTDASNFNSYRGISSQIRDGYQGVFASSNNTLASSNSDYSTYARRRVINKVAYFGRQALQTYDGATLRTVAGTGTLNQTDAANIQSNVTSTIDNSCGSNYQNVLVSPSLTQNVLQTGIEQVTIAVTPFAYSDQIKVTIGFTLG